MAEAKIEALIRQCDELIRNCRKLFDYNFSNELPSVLSTFMENQKAIEAKLYEQTKECEQLKESLGKSHDKVAKLYSKYEDLMKHYQYVKEFDFSKLKTRCELDEKTNVTLNLEGGDLFRCFDERSRDLISNELIEEADVEYKFEDLKFQFEQLKLQFEEKNDECRRLKSNLNEANEKITTLDSELRKARELLKEGNLHRKQVESERDNSPEKLRSLLLEYQQPVIRLDKIRETNSQICCDDSISSIIESESESDLVLRIDTSESEDELDVDLTDSNLPIPKTDKCRDCNISVENIDSNDPLLKKDEHVQNESHETSVNLKSTIVKCPSENERKINFTKFSLFESFDRSEKIQESTSSQTSNDGILLPNSLAVGLSNSRISTTPEQSHFECNTCGKSFLKKIGIIKHVQVHIKTIQSFHCKKCDKSFPTKNSRQKSEKCPICNRNDTPQSNKNETTKTSNALIGKKKGKHQIDNYFKKCQDEITDTRCVVCDEHYATKANLNRHMREVHNREKPYECAKCGKFFSKAYLKIHALVHGSQRLLKCSVCDASFKYRYSKRRHERIVHEGSSNFRCAHCDKRFGQKHHLIRHIHAKHFAILQKQFKCTICDKSYALKQDLQAHKFSHASKRSFKCSVCDRYYKHPTEKIKHETTVHGIGALFRCKHCNKAFRWKINFIRHLETNHVE